MSLSEKKSSAELSTFIESYWCYDGRGINDLVLFPDGTFNIFFAFHPFQLRSNNRIFKPGVYLIPLSSVPVTINSSQNVYGIRFKAFSLLNIMGGAGNELTLLNDLDAFTTRSPTLKHIQEKIDADQTIEEISVELEKVAFELLNKEMNVNLDLRDKVNYILDKKGQIRVDEMAKDFGVSRQALHKNFKKNLLITPKELAAIWQLNHFFTLADNSTDSLTGLALDAGYYDQAHFINSFKLKFGMSPKQFIKSNSQVFNYATQNMSKRFNNYYDPE